MKVLFIEDNYFASKLSEWIKDYGFTILSAENLLDAEKLLETQGPFDAAIVDLDLDKRYLPRELQQYARTEYAGWVYYKHVLRKIPPLDRNAIIVSAFLPYFKASLPGDEYDSLILIDKADSQYHKQVLNSLKLLSGESTEDKAGFEV